MAQVLVPYPEFEQDIRALRPDVTVAAYSPSSLPPAHEVREVRFFVPPYAFDARALALARHMPELRVMQLLTAGFDRALPFRPPWVDLCNAKGVHDSSTAELAVALTLASQRGIPEFVGAQRSGAWAHAQYPSLADRRVLLLGYGGVGAAIEQRLSGFEVEIVRVAARERSDPVVHPVARARELLAAADVVIVSVPLNGRTRRLVDASFLSRMRDGALLVNVARGGVVDTDALLEEVSRGRLRAALDVTEPEPLPADHPLWSSPGVLITPHVGGNSTAFLPRARRLVRSQVRRFVDGQAVANVVASPDGRGGPPPIGTP